MLAIVDLGADLRRVRVNAGGLRIENSPALIEGGVRPVRHPVGAHTQGEFRHVVLDLLVHGRGRRDAGTAVWEQVPAGLAAAGYRGLSAAPSTWGFGHTPLLFGSGKFGTPLERMQWEKASGWEFTDELFVEPPALEVPPEPVDDGLPPHAAASRTRTAVATMAATVRALGDHGRSGRRFKRGVFLVMPSPDWMIVPAVGVGIWHERGAARGCDVHEGGPRDRVRNCGPWPPRTARSTESASCQQVYAGARDISATRDVGRMSCPPAHTGAMRVLVVEDHTTLADRIAQGLRQAGMAVDAVYDGAAAIEAAAQTAYDVIVLDRDLPVVHGDRVCQKVAGSGPRILMLTAAADVDDRVDGLELGADDYLPKPFEFAELVARVRALSAARRRHRRSCTAATSPWTAPGTAPGGARARCPSPARSSGSSRR